MRLKAPFPYFGGKSKVASLVWDRLGDVDNFVEPFCGSAAVLLARPHPPRIETVNDADCYLANFWRATQHDPEAVAAHADGPVNEADLHARHKWLVLSEHAADFRRRMRSDPDYYDAKVAGWWCWGLCCWIGSGWCCDPEQPVNGPAGGSGERSPDLGMQSIHAAGDTSEQVPRLSAAGQGLNAKMPNCDGRGMDAAAEPGERLPKLSSGDGVPSTPSPSEQLPLIGDQARGGHRGPADTNRPQLADAYARGRGVHNDNHLAAKRDTLGGEYSQGKGVHANDTAGACAERRAWLLDWFGRLRDRLRTVRVCCGDWLRVCDSESVTTRLGTTGIFFDPPYGTGAGRDAKIYAVDSLTVAQDVRAYCLERGADPRMRICLAGYAGEGHEDLEKRCWEVVNWAANGGYGNRSAKGKANAKKERLWFSPGCRGEKSLFEGLENGA